MFEEESKKHQEEITERQKTQMQEMLEKKFAAEFKLGNPDGTDFNAMEGEIYGLVTQPNHFFF